MSVRGKIGTSDADLDLRREDDTLVGGGDVSASSMSSRIGGCSMGSSNSSISSTDSVCFSAAKYEERRSMDAGLATEAAAAMDDFAAPAW